MRARAIVVTETKTSHHHARDSEVVGAEEYEILEPHAGDYKKLGGQGPSQTRR